MGHVIGFDMTAVSAVADMAEISLTPTEARLFRVAELELVKIYEEARKP